MRIHFGGAAELLEMQEPGDVYPRGKRLAVQITTLLAGHESSPDGVHRWTDTEDARLEKQLSQIVSTLLQRAEAAYRSVEEQRYQALVRLRQEAIRQRAQRQEEQEVQRLRDIEVHQQRIRMSIIALAADRRTADDIRALVAVMKSHPDSVMQSDSLREWCACAQNLADELDPLHRPLKDMLSTFRCGGAT
jgi:hypothetical protein